MMIAGIEPFPLSFRTREIENGDATIHVRIGSAKPKRPGLLRRIEGGPARNAGQRLSTPFGQLSPDGRCPSGSLKNTLACHYV